MKESQGQVMNEQRAKRRVLLSCAAAVALAAMCGVLALRVRSAALSLEQRVLRIAQTQSDVARIVKLRMQPKQATEIRVPLSDLVADIARAMVTANIPAERFISSMPLAPRRAPGMAHVELGLRLVFDGVSTESIVRFCHALTEARPELEIASLHLSAKDQTNWEGEIAVTYRLLSPVEDRRRS